MTHTFAIFPYLKTTAEVRFRELVFRSSEEASELPEDAVKHLETLRELFYLRTHVRIKKMTYAFHVGSVDGSVEFSGFLRQLLEFQALVSFIYSKPHSTFGEPFLRSEHAALFLIQPKRVSRSLLFNGNDLELSPEIQNLQFDSRDEIDGYEVILNYHPYSWITSLDHIFPPAIGLWLNNSQDLSIDLKRAHSSNLYGPVLSYFQKTSRGIALTERVHTAITWYNRTLELGNDEAVNLVHLAIAFECLLNLEGTTNVTNRFNEAVRLLVGEVPRLDSWLTQFYKARSKIVHEGRSSQLYFVATDNVKKMPDDSTLEYRSLVSFGRQVFHVCISALLTGASLAEQLHLAPMLVTNQQRLERICKILREGTETPAERLLASAGLIREIETYRFVQEKGLTNEQLIGTAKLVARSYFDSSPSVESPAMMEMLENLANIDSGNHYEALSLIVQLHESWMSGQRGLLSEAQKLVFSLINSVWHYTFTYYIKLDREQKANDSE